MYARLANFRASCRKVRVMPEEKGMEDKGNEERRVCCLFNLYKILLLCVCVCVCISDVSSR